MKKLVVPGLFVAAVASGAAFAQRSSDDQTRANVSNFKFVVGGDAIVTAKKGAVLEAHGGGIQVRIDDAVLDLVGGYPIRISSGIYDPRSKTLRVDGSVRVFKTKMTTQSLGEPVDDHDEPIDLTCKRGKLPRNGIPTPKSSTCVGESARMTCNADDSATFNFSDPTCSGFEDPAG